MILDRQDFHLCGSRAVGNSTVDSDWDYVASWNDQSLPNRLIDMGFTRIDTLDDANYRDTNTMAVFRHVKQNVEVALVLDVQAKLNITTALRFSPVLRDLDRSLKGKVDRIYLWNAFYTMAGVSKYNL